MHYYKQEFGEGFELSRFSFLKDKNWHNDVCPSFVFKAKVNSDRSIDLEQSEQYLVLWVDYLKEGQRVNTGSSRYTVITATRFSESEWDIEVEHDEDSVTLFESKDPNALVLFLEKHSLPSLTISDITL